MGFCATLPVVRADLLLSLATSVAKHRFFGARLPEFPLFAEEPDARKAENFGAIPLIKEEARQANERTN